MNLNKLNKQFSRIGARVDVRATRAGFAVNIGRDQRGSLFTIDVNPAVTQVHAIDPQPRLRHLILQAQGAGAGTFLCGHDERDWFAAAVPGGGVSKVREAMEQLKPAAVRLAVAQAGVKLRRRNDRHNAAFVRQGEWFFLPMPQLTFDRMSIRYDEPLSRGRGKSHWVEELVRSGGELVYVSSKFPQGLTETQHRKKLSNSAAYRALQVVPMRRNPQTFARGKVRHPDHKTIRLDGWHQVFMNTENQASSMRFLAFLD